MTKAQALYDFFNRFGVPAYPDTAVPDEAKLPYMDYEVKTGSFGNAPVAISLKLYMHTDSESEPNKKAEEIGKYIGESGRTIKCDDGLMWIKKGDPFSLNQNVEDDNSTKLRFMNLYVEYITL